MKTHLSILAAILIGLAVLIPATGCQHLSPESKEAAVSIGKQAAKIGVLIGLEALGGSVKELQPYLPGLYASINASFASSDDPAEVAASVVEQVDLTIAPEYRAAVLAEIARAASGEDTVAAGNEWGKAFSGSIGQ